MRCAREVIQAPSSGWLLIVVPVYLAVLLILKGMKSVASVVRPFAALLPTGPGRAVLERMEIAFFGRLPGTACSAA
jgi:hypothetical protein